VSELKPCQNCGQLVRVAPMVTDPGWGVFHECLVQAPTEAEAIAAWNSRPTVQAPVVINGGVMADVMYLLPGELRDRLMDIVASPEDHELSHLRPVQAPDLSMLYTTNGPPRPTVQTPVVPSRNTAKRLVYAWRDKVSLNTRWTGLKDADWTALIDAIHGYQSQERVVDEICTMNSVLNSRIMTVLPGISDEKVTELRRAVLKVMSEGVDWESVDAYLADLEFGQRDRKATLELIRPLLTSATHGYREQMAACFLAGYEAHINDPWKCRPYAYLATITEGGKS